MKIKFSYALVLNDCKDCKSKQQVSFVITNRNIKLGCVKCGRFVEDNNIDNVCKSWNIHNENKDTVIP
jgi:hypothetical protein